jgi:hypothetical protein
MKNPISNHQAGKKTMQKQHILLTMGIFIMACSPTVKVEAPDKPITINLNVKIEHEIRVKVDKELDDVFSTDSGLF